MTKPNFFIVGAPKCGTTAMSDYLSQHPNIFKGPKELHYFGSDLQLRHRIAKENYLAFFQQTGCHKIIGEASVWYLFSKHAAKEIKAFSPEAKVLIMLRNPVDVVHSLHSQNLYDGNEDVKSFEAAIQLDEVRAKGKRTSKSVDFFRLPGYKESTLFSEQVERYIDVFGKENVHVILYEDFATDTDKTVREVLQFLGIDVNAKIQYRVINTNKAIRFFHLHRLIKRPPRYLKRTIRTILPARRVRHAIMVYLSKNNIKLEKRTELTLKLTAELKSYFASDIKALGKLLNRDLSSWLS